MTILVTGGAGQLATAMVQEGREAVVRVGRPEFDFDRPGSVAATFAAIAPTVVVNAAAWTAVDKAESEVEAAMRANRDGPAELARLCAAAGVPLIHISTDYVFDGDKGEPYVETDPTSPTGAYGATKLAGEQAVLAGWGRSVVLRTSWVYSATGSNFVRTMLRAAETRDHLRVVGDQKGCPTAARDLAAAVLQVASQVRAGWQDSYAGVFHAAGSGWTTWHGLATAVFEDAAGYGRPMPTVEAIRTADWPTPARRPADSRLDCDKLARVFGVRQPDWRGSVARTVGELLGGTSGGPGADRRA